MTNKKSDPKIRELHNLRDRQLFGMVAIMIGILTVIFGAEILRKATDVALDQVEELTDRVAQLKASPSEPAKT